MDKKTGYIILIIVLAIVSTILIEIMKLGIKNKGFLFQNNYQLINENEYDSSNINDIRIDLSSSDVEVYLSEDNKIKIEQYGNEKTAKYIDEVSENSIEIREKIKIFMFFINYTKYKVYLPKDYVGNFNILTVSGDINVQNMSDKVNKLSLKTTSGDIEFLSTINSESLNLKTVSGDIDVISVNTNNLSMQTTSGDISANEINTTSTDLKTVSGYIKIQSLVGSDDITTTSGDIKISNLLCSNNGTIHTVSGEVDIKMNDNSNCLVDTDTVSGSERISKNNYGSGNYKLKIKTTSGDIRVD